MNIEFQELFGAEIPLIPLREAGKVVCENAARTEWTEVCDPVGETYVLGNPPYSGSSMQSAEQKADFVAHFGTTRYPASLDYVALWFLKGAEFLAAEPRAKVAFVATNSIAQGDHVGLMWPRVFDAGAQISFAHQSFRWSNRARGNAGVSCVVVGLAATAREPKNVLYTEGVKRAVTSISPYLSQGPQSLIVHPRRSPISDLPQMLLGSKPVDDGQLILSGHEVAGLVASRPEAERFIRRYGGSKEAISGNWRHCIWIEDSELAAALAIPEIARRLERVRAFRTRSKKPTTRAFAASPHRFCEARYRASNAIFVPEVSSERRDYVPIDFVGPDTVISNKAYAVYGGEPWLFGLLHSRMHMTWVTAVAGRLESRLSYSAGLVYNTFPVPAISDDQRAKLTQTAVAVLSAREQFSGQTLAQLYDPDKMPSVLRSAHRDLDDAADALYQSKPFESDAARLEMLFGMYEAATRAEPVTSGA
jgi:hypothetical protein